MSHAAPAAAAAEPEGTSAQVARLWSEAGPALRRRMLALLISPLGTLALAGVADGVFARLLLPGGSAAATVAQQYSAGEIQALVEFALQVDPGVVTLVQKVAGG